MRGAVVAVVAACVLWGASFPLAKVALTALSPAHLVLWRFLLAAPVLVAVLVARRAAPSVRELPLLVVTGVLCVPVSYLLQFAGLARTTVTSASLLVAAATPLLALAAWLVDGERLPVRGWVAVVLSTLGAGLLVGIPGPGRSWIGDLLVLASIVVSVAWMLTSKRLARTHGAAVATAWILLVGTAALAPAVLATEGLPPLALGAGVWASLGALALGSTVGAFVLWNAGLERMESGRAGVYLNLEPLVGAGAGVALFGDAVGPVVAGGGALVVAGAVLASLGGRRVLSRRAARAGVADRAGREGEDPRP